MKRIAITVVCSALFLSTACKKETPEPEKKKYSIEVDFGFTVDTGNLVFDTLVYTNQAGNVYSISKLELILSDVRLLSGSASYPIGNVYYLNAQKASTLHFNLESVPPGNYTGIRCTIGLDSLRNKSNSLPNTIDFNQMFWPEQLGGGYHFMKLEGRFLDDSVANGYAMHLGKHPNAVICELPLVFTIEKSVTKMNLRMNVNEWFRQPFTYNFKTDGRFTMSSDALMQKLSANGVDVLEIQSIQ